jgi:alpha-tubulin suppressor-like RCC1 family protein
VLAAVASVAVLLLGMTSAAQGTPSGELYSFGRNAFGQLGNTIDNGSDDPNPTPAAAVLPGASGPVTQVAAGYNHSLALTSTGQLYAFGYNGYGQLGTATNSGTGKASPTPALVVLPGANGPVTQVAAGYGHSLAVTSTGQLYAFGRNHGGQLGNTTNNGTLKANPTPALVVLPGASGPVTQVAAGFDHSLAVTSTGQLYAFGVNPFGELGTWVNAGTTNANPTPALVGLPGATGPVTQIAAGEDHSLALTSTGQLYAFGFNDFGQLGTPTNSGTFKPNPVAALVVLPGASGPVTEIAAGSYHSLALTSTGQLYAFGKNQSGQLGITPNNDANPTPALVGLPGASGPVTQIAAGGDHSLALTSAGQLYAFGRNRFGQLGTTINSGTDAANPTPLPVKLPRGLIAAAIGISPLADHTLLILTTAPQPPQSTRPPQPLSSPSLSTVPVLSVLRVAPQALSLGGRLVNGRCVKPTSSNHNRRRCRRTTALRISYTLNLAATVTFTLTRREPGRSVNGRCVKPTTQNHKRRRCSRLSTVPGSINHASKAGSTTFTFDGHVAGRTLSPGNYMLTGTPTTNDRRGIPVSIAIRLVT